MNSHARARVFFRLAPLTLVAVAAAAMGVTAVGGSAQASPVLAANLRLMDHTQMASTGPAIHSMVAPAPAGIDPTKPVSDATLARRAGIALDGFGRPLTTTGTATTGTEPTNPTATDPTPVTSAATAPTGTPHMTNFLRQHVAPSCVGTGTDGKRVQVVYAYETGTAS